MISNVNQIIKDYIHFNYTSNESIIFEEFNKLHKEYENYDADAFTNSKLEFNEVQNILSTINERTNKRKRRGVYYTPADVISFIINSSIKINLTNDDFLCTNLHNSKNDITLNNCLYKNVLDPTCGTGEFLLEFLKIKLEILVEKPSKEIVFKVIKTIYGNDIDSESIYIAKCRIILYILDTFGIEHIIGLVELLNTQFNQIDFLRFDLSFGVKFDYIIGNPPYVEDKKYGSTLPQKFGNIYANVLYTSQKYLNYAGTIGFIIPISYISTPRMKSIRKYISDNFNTQYILNYADRPDCLFTGVHQKLCILIASNTSKKGIYTTKYQYWYKSERKKLFNDINVVNNPYIMDAFIPKLGSNIDINIFSKVILNNEYSNSIFDVLNQNKEHDEYNIYFSMRAAFWIKAFINSKKIGEYKEFSFADENIRNYVYCLLNSSLFWWFWIAVSDGWHITNKELLNFKYLNSFDNKTVKLLANNLENKLESTKKYIGSRQVDYEYKHRFCLNEINAIDDYICKIYNLTESEINYIKKFAEKYRLSLGK